MVLTGFTTKPLRSLSLGDQRQPAVSGPAGRLPEEGGGSESEAAYDKETQPFALAVEGEGSGWLRVGLLGTCSVADARYKKANLLVYRKEGERVGSRRE